LDLFKEDFPEHAKQHEDSMTDDNFNFERKLKTIALGEKI
jgi:hypothetical protein